MNVTRILKRPTQAMALYLGMAACGTMDDRGPLAPTIDLIQSNLANPEDDQSIVRPAITPELVASLPTSVAFFEAVDPDRFAAAGLVIHNVTSDPGRWTSLDGKVAFILKQGLPVRSHGLGVGLGNADVDPTLRALASGRPQSLTREMRYLDGEYHEIIRHFACDFSPESRETITVFERPRETRRYVERCSDGAFRFENRYWRDNTGIVWRSETWLSPRFGMLRLERLSVVAGP